MGKFRIEEIIFPDCSSKFYVQKRFLWIFWRNVKVDSGMSCLDGEFIINFIKPSKYIVTNNLNHALNICNWLKQPNRAIYTDEDTYYFAFPVNPKAIWGKWYAYSDFNHARYKERTLREEQDKTSSIIKTRKFIHKVQ